MTDEFIIDLVLRGRRDEFATLVARYQHSAVQTAFHLIGDREAAEDVAQEAFVDAYRNLRQLRDRTHFKPWLFAILHNQCLKHRERRRETVPLEEATATAALVAEDPATDGDGPLVSLMNQLPFSHREILAARYLNELSYDEIARVLGTTAGNVRVRCLRAKQKLREAFDRDAARCKGD